MVPNITAILQRLPGEWAALLQPDAILAVCRETGVYCVARPRAHARHHDAAVPVADSAREHRLPSSSGVLKELTVFTIVYNLVRMVMCQSARLQHLNVERISCLDALRWLGAPSTGVPLIALIVNPARPYRVEPRVKKRRPKSFPFMITPRQGLRQRLLPQELGG